MKEQLLTKSPINLMFQLSIPAVIGMLVIGLYPLMDGIFAGQIIGEKAMAACSVSMPLTLANNGIAVLIGIGSASILSRALGKGDYKKVDKIMGNLIFWVLLFSIIIMITGILLSEKFLLLLGTTKEIRSLGVRYLRIIFLGSIFVNFTQSANMVMRGEGLMKKAMMIMGLGAALNIILDPIFMIAMGDNAIEGAAIATILSQSIQGIVTLNYFVRKSKIVKIHKIKPEKEIYGEMFSVGVSAMFMQILFMVQQTILYKQAFKYGGEPSGILMSATMRLYGFSFIPIWGMSQGLQPIIGTNFGARKIDRVRETMKIFCIGGTVLAALFWIPAELFSEKILLLFKISPEIIAKGITNFRLFYSIFMLYGIMIMIITYFQSIGDGKKAGLIVMFRQLILFIPAMILLPMFFGSTAVWWAEPVVDFIVIISGILILIKDFKKQSYKMIQG